MYFPSFAKHNTNINQIITILELLYDSVILFQPLYTNIFEIEKKKTESFEKNL